MTKDELISIMPKTSLLKADLYVQCLNEAMIESEINTPLRQAAFLAQIAHESDEFKYMSEVWGPTPTQIRYDPPSSLSKRLGNLHLGDGYKYRGGGPLQLTGRANYTACGQALGIDLESNPDLARIPQTGFRTAGWFWGIHKLNELADISDFNAITKKINGGYNGLEQRNGYYFRAKATLGI